VTLGQYNLKPGTEITVTTIEEELEARADITVEEALAEAQAIRETTGVEERERRRRGFRPRL